MFKTFALALLLGLVACDSGSKSAIDAHVTDGPVVVVDAPKAADAAPDAALVCDGTGVCGDNTTGCLACANTNICSAQRTACNSNAACLQLETCLAACPPDSQACLQQCAATHPNGVAAYGALGQCMACACKSDCAVNVTCP